MQITMVSRKVGQGQGRDFFLDGAPYACIGLPLLLQIILVCFLILSSVWKRSCSVIIFFYFFFRQYLSFIQNSSAKDYKRVKGISFSPPTSCRLSLQQH